MKTKTRTRMFVFFLIILSNIVLAVTINPNTVTHSVSSGSMVNFTEQFNMSRIEITSNSTEIYEPILYPAVQMENINDTNNAEIHIYNITEKTLLKYSDGTNIIKDAENINITLEPGQDVILSNDTTDPLLNAYTPFDGKVFISDNITGQFNFSDDLLYSWNVSVDGTTLDNATNVAYSNYSYNLSINPRDYNPGQHNLTIKIADGHTAQEIEDYEVSKGFLTADKIKFDTGENVLEIKPKNTNWFDVFMYEKLKDRYTFSYKPSSKSKDNIYHFNINTEQPLNIVRKPDTKYRVWIISGNNWLDFYSHDIDMDSLNITKISETQAEVSFYSENDKFQFESVGDLNIVENNYSFYTLNASTTYTEPVFEQENTVHNMTVNITGTPYSYNDVNATLWYNNTQYTATKTSDTEGIHFTRTVLSPEVASDSNITFSWEITATNNSVYNLTDNQTIYNVGIANCVNEPTWNPALNITGYTETTISRVGNFSVNINIEFVREGSVDKEFGLEFKDNDRYQICIENNELDYVINAQMEYYQDNYSNRKYYLNNYTLDNTTDSLDLYNIDTDLSSDIIVTVYNPKTGERMPKGFLKVQRYYPEDDNDTISGYRTIEVGKTDSLGQTSIKAVLADVWYKFIFEYPAGTVLLNTDVEKLLTVNKDLPITTTDTDFNYDNYLKVSKDVSCTKSIQTCRFTWSDSTGIATKGELRVYEDTGFARKLIYSNNLTSTAGTIAYTIPGNITNKKYVAEGWVYANE